MSEDTQNKIAYGALGAVGVAVVALIGNAVTDSGVVRLFGGVPAAEFEAVESELAALAEAQAELRADLDARPDPEKGDQIGRAHV